MENRKEFTFPSADGRTAIHAVEWHPAGEPGRHFADRARRGGVRAALRAVRALSERARLPWSWRTTTSATASRSPRARRGSTSAKRAAGSTSWTICTRSAAGPAKPYPELPYFIMGHSMGSFLTRTYLIRYPGTVKGAILMGTGQNPDAMLVGAARRSQAYWQGRSGARTRATSWKSSPSAPTTRPSRLTARATTG